MTHYNWTNCGEIMHVQVHPYVFYLAISTLISLLAAFIAWWRSAPGSFTLRMLLLSMAVWSGSYAMSWLDISSPAKLFWLKTMYTGVVSIPVLYLIYVLQFTHHERWLKPLHVSLLFVIPVISLLLQWTNEYHHLIYRSINSLDVNGMLVVQYMRGPWYFVIMVYSYAVIAAGFVLLIVGTIRSSPVLRNQYYQFLLASSIPWAASLYSELNFSTALAMDLAPVSFGLSGILFAYSFFRYRFMDLIPVARSRLIENMSDGILVLDAQGRIVDINPAMARLLNNESQFYIGKNVSSVLKDWWEQISTLLNDDTRTELRLPHMPSRYMDLRMTPLYDAQQNLSGRIIVFRDITDRKQVEKDLMRANDKLHTQLIEIGLLQSQLREQAIRDPLTNLFNRRYLEETLERELARAEREEYPLCIVMMDIDHFKDVNDTYGHEAGDIVLRTLAETITAGSRHGDFACRYGGEELVLVMPNINIETAMDRADELHQTINRLYIPYGRFNLSITISVGVACYPDHGNTKEELLRAADQALYAAKHAGRNRVSIYNKSESNDIEALEIM